MRQSGGILRQNTWGHLSVITTVMSMVLLALVALLPGCVSFRPTPEANTTRLNPKGELMRQTQEEAHHKSAGCLSCHTSVDAPTMHLSPAVHLGCTDCHGGNADVHVPSGVLTGAALYQRAKQQAHVQPRLPQAWPTSANPVRSYTLLNQENPAFIRFVNPGDLRVSQETCGGCHRPRPRP